MEVLYFPERIQTIGFILPENVTVRLSRPRIQLVIGRKRQLVLLGIASNLFGMCPLNFILGQQFLMSIFGLMDNLCILLADRAERLVDLLVRMLV